VLVESPAIPVELPAIPVAVDATTVVDDATVEATVVVVVVVVVISMTEGAEIADGTRPAAAEMLKEVL